MHSKRFEAIASEDEWSMRYKWLLYSSFQLVVRKAPASEYLENLEEIFTGSSSQWVMIKLTVSIGLKCPLNIKTSAWLIYYKSQLES